MSMHTRGLRRSLAAIIVGLTTVAVAGFGTGADDAGAAQGSRATSASASPTRRPIGFATPDGKLTGESPEVVRAVLAKMGIAQVDGVLTEFGSLIPGLQAGRFDIIAAGMFVNPKRCEQVQFSEPTYGIGQAFLVAKGNPKGIADYGSHRAATTT